MGWPGRTRPAEASWAAHSASGSEARRARGWRPGPGCQAGPSWRRWLGGGRWGRALGGGRSRGPGRAAEWSPRTEGPRRGLKRGRARDHGRAPRPGHRAELGRGRESGRRRECGQVRQPDHLSKVGGPGGPGQAGAARGVSPGPAGHFPRVRRGRRAMGGGTWSRSAARAEPGGGRSRDRPGPRARPARAAGGQRAAEPGATGRRTPRWRAPGPSGVGHRRRPRPRRGRGGSRAPGCPPRSSPPFRPEPRCRIPARKGLLRLILVHPGSVGADTLVWVPVGESRPTRRPGTGGHATADRRGHATFSQALSWLVRHARASPGYSQAVYRRMRRPTANAAGCARAIPDSTDLTVRAAHTG